MKREAKKSTSTKQTAKKYVDEQLQLLKQHGTNVSVSKAEYDSIVSQVMSVSIK